MNQADIAKARGCARSTVSRACLPGGALHPALMPGADRVDAAHPACRGFVGVVSASTVYGMATPHAIELGMAEAPARVSVPACGGCGELYGSYDGTPIAEFALRAEQPITTVRAALRGELAPALLKSGLLDIGHRASLTFLARYPLARSADDDPLDPPIDGHDFVVRRAPTRTTTTSDTRSFRPSWLATSGESRPRRTSRSSPHHDFVDRPVFWRDALQKRSAGSTRGFLFLRTCRRDERTQISLRLATLHRSLPAPAMVGGHVPEVAGTAAAPAFAIPPAPRVFGKRRIAATVSIAVAAQIRSQP